MTESRTRILVGPDHRISGTAPAVVPPGKHEVTIDVASLPVRRTPMQLSMSTPSPFTTSGRGLKG